jgi:hypothetical protein
VAMMATIQELEEKRKYLIGCIEYLKVTIEKIKTNDGELEEDYCIEQIDFNEHSIAGYQNELHQIESEIAGLSEE